ncbi:MULTISPECIES: 2-hydroxyacyl-CoA dehydratase subunit D [unclassified Sphingomonas]|uniref:2-hydroxyacyl-CoA dehydratase subunit D n=1 Tax=unclassified Sphingomonas TaxID=196159 RepID=UPI00082AE2EB|nr:MULTISPECIES: 2-hydroxyacyl-CoA dehydratase family protein [unclassified Sphingomonas]
MDRTDIGATFNAGAPLTRLREVAADPSAYVTEWKRQSGRRVLGVLPMNLPLEIVDACGALPVIIQETREPITVGNTLLVEFNCGYTRNLADQAGLQRMGGYDGFVFADHCIQLFGAADVIRAFYPDKPLFFSQLISAMGDPWSFGEAKRSLETLVAELSEFVGRAVTPDDLRRSIAARNENRRLQREIFAARREGRIWVTASDLQAIVKSSMVMDVREHTALLRRLHLAAAPLVQDGSRVKVHLSGHFCHAPQVELLDLIEDAGGLVVDDDLYHGFRFISTDAPEDIEPIDALTRWYLDRNTAVPCPTRVQNDVDWDGYLLRATQRSGAEAIIVLMAKFCEPHMLYYPELRRGLDAHEVPHLLLETEHEGVPEETIRTRLEALFERVHRKRSAPARSAAQLTPNLSPIA